MNKLMSPCKNWQEFSLGKNTNLSTFMALALCANYILSINYSTSCMHGLLSSYRLHVLSEKSGRLREICETTFGL